MLSGHGSAWRRRRNSRAARIAVPLAIPMALGLTLGIVLAVSGVITAPPRARSRNRLRARPHVQPRITGLSRRLHFVPHLRRKDLARNSRGSDAARS